MQYATAKIGAILVNVNPAYRTHELQLRPQPVGLPAAGRGDRAHRTSDYRAMVDEVRADCPALEKVVLPRRRRLGRALATTRVDAERRCWRARRRARAPTTRSTSSTRRGTTGFPKGATLSHHNILNNGYFVGELLGYTEHDRVCIPVPFYHCFGMVMGNLGAPLTARRIVHPRAGVRPGGDARRRSRTERCTSLYGVPTMFIAELALPELRRLRPVARLRTGIMAGSPCPVEVMKRVVTEMHMAEVTICYGMTETSPGVDA